MAGKPKWSKRELYERRLAQVRFTQMSGGIRRGDSYKNIPNNFSRSDFYLFTDIYWFPGAELHRIDNDAGYSWDNCVYLTPEEHLRMHGKQRCKHFSMDKKEQMRQRASDIRKGRNGADKERVAEYMSTYSKQNKDRLNAYHRMWERRQKARKLITSVPEAEFVLLFG